MIHLGDITKIKGNEVPITDVVCFGAPCQDISQAGLRKGMKHTEMGDEETTRSGLFFDAVRVIKEMRAEDAERGNTDVDIRPRYGVYENVVGAFSSNRGLDFQAVLQELVKVAEPKAPPVPVPEKGWSTSGCLFDEMGKWSLAWRVLDAQFWGVPQRRRRICLVCDFNGLNAPKIVFGEAEHDRSTEQSGRNASVRYSGAKSRPSLQSLTESLSGHSGESQPKRKTTARDVAVGSGGTSKGIPYTMKIRSGVEVDSQGKKAGKGALIQTNKSGCINTVQGQYLFQPMTADHHAVCSYNIGDRFDVPKEHIEMSPTLTARMGTGGNNVPAVAYDKFLFENHPQDSRVRGPLEVAPTVSGKFGTGGNNVPLVTEPICINERQVAGKATVYGISPYHSNSMKSDNPNSGIYEAETARSLDAMNCGSPTCNQGGMAVVEQVPTGHQVKYIVRRLTPCECELLQGFPKNWTNIGEWVDSNGKTRKLSDSARYKALGNSIALPPWKWVLKRLCACYERDATMASLFDGIGGFPLIWEQLNGKGSCLWASEIEDFPMAVTKLRFGDGS